MKNLIKALIAFQSECPELTFDAEVKYGGTRFRYATLGKIIKVVKPILTKNGLAFVQYLDENCLKTILFHESGESIESCHSLPVTSKPQDLGSWITYIKRYSLASLLGLYAEEDQDGKVSEPVSKVTKSATKSLTQNQFNRAVESFKNGDIDVFDRAKTKGYSLTKEQSLFLNDLNSGA